MKKILFIGYDFHNKTKSSDFLVELLRQRYEVDVVRVASDISEIELKSKIPGSNYDVLIVWEVSLLHIRFENVVRFRKGLFFPMYDILPKKIYHHRIFWKYRHFTIFCFCKIMYDNLRRMGMDARYIQYAPPVAAAATVAPGDPCSVFFWRRKEEISIPLLEVLRREYPLTRVYLHNVPDPGEPAVEWGNFPRDMVETGNWFDSKSDLIREISGSALYLAPRLYEGIGMSFLEAMALGRCVIAPDLPTMNEYIRNGETGILYDPEDPHFAFTADDVRRIQSGLADYMAALRSRWENIDSQTILSAVETEYPFHYPCGASLLFWAKMLARKIKRSISNS